MWAERARERARARRRLLQTPDRLSHALLSAGRAPVLTTGGEAPGGGWAPGRPGRRGAGRGAGLSPPGGRLYGPRSVVATVEFGSTAVVLLGAGAAFAVLFAVVLAVRYAASFPDLPPPGPQTSDLGPEPPAVANLLVNRCSVTRSAAAATLVDLAARRHLELFEAGPGRVVVRVRPDRPDPLNVYERQLLDLVRTKATGGSAPLEAIQLDPGQASSWHARFAKQVASDAKARGLLRGRWSQLDWSLFGALAALAVFFVAAGLYAAHVELGTATSTSTSTSTGAQFHREDWFWIAAFAWTVIVAGVARLRSVRYSTSGTEAAARWLGVKRFLRQDPSFADATPGAVAIWDRLLAYGTALGVARATASAIPLDLEDRSTAWSRAGGDWHQVHIEYPRHFGYGQPPRSVLLGGVAHAVGWGVLAFVALPIVANALWTLGSDATHHSKLGDGATLGLVAVFFVALTAVAVVLLLRFADGLVRVWRGALDLGRVDEVEGPVVKVLSQGVWFAVDPGTVDHVRAWHRGAAQLPVAGSTVRVSVTPHLGYVRTVTVLSAPAAALAPAPADAATGAPIAWSAGAGGDPADAAAGPVDAAAVQASTGLDLPEVDPSSLSLGKYIPAGAAVRAFSDGTNQVLVGTVPPDTPRAGDAGAGGVPEGGGRERWVAGQLLLQHGPAGLVAVEVDLQDRSSEQRHQIARALAARVTQPPTT